MPVSQYWMRILTLPIRRMGEIMGAESNLTDRYVEENDNPTSRSTGSPILRAAGELRVGRMRRNL